MSADRLVVSEPAEQAEARLAELAELVRRHPRVARAIIGALVEEGRRFAATEQGARLRGDLERSEVLQRATAVWRSLGLDRISLPPASFLPSRLVAALIAAGSPGERA